MSLVKNADAAQTNQYRWNSFAGGLIAATLLIGAGNFLLNGPHQPTAAAGLGLMGPIGLPISNPVQMPIPIPMPVPNPLPPVPVKPTPHPVPYVKKVLSAKQSQITGIIDPETLTSSYYWTVVLHNGTTSVREAIMDVALPNDAAVTRATLWVNGVAQEAAFQSKEQVETAYDWVVNRHRDPLLVTQTAKGQVHIQASPVMPGKDMQLRIGITVPMTVDASSADLTLPFVLNSNVLWHQPTNLHLTSTSEMSAQNTTESITSQKLSNQNTKRAGDQFILRAKIPTNKAHRVVITTIRHDNTRQFATRATHSLTPSYIVATILRGQLKLQKTADTPNCKIVKSEEAAHRLSNLWAHKTIERLVDISEEYDAVELASVYRVVSPVSGAVVLERNSDYEQMGLDRNLYKSTDIGLDIDEKETEYKQQPREKPIAEYTVMPDAAAVPAGVRMRRAESAQIAEDRRAVDKKQATFNEEGQSGANLAPMPSASPAPVSRSMSSIDAELPTKSQSQEPKLESPNLGEYAPYERDAVRSPQTRSDATVLTRQNTDTANPATNNQFQLLIASFICGLAFAGPAVVLISAIANRLNKKTDSKSIAIFGLAWLTCACIYPIASITILAIFLIEKAFKSGFTVSKKQQ